VFRHGDRILVQDCYDPTDDERFFRPLGGAIEFGEYSQDALRREIREEIGAEITGLRLLGTLENIFTFDGTPGHEIVIVYDGAFVDRRLYDQPQITGVEDNDIPFTALWCRLADLAGPTPLYPDGLYALLCP
jgi:8-oxo-dGTP pyrophosphatase MutT (NUDIX family)